jgi:hypothetical protein
MRTRVIASDDLPALSSHDRLPIGGQLLLNRRRFEHDLECVRLGCGREHIVGPLGLAEGEVMGRKRRRIKLPALDQLQELGRGAGIDPTPNARGSSKR